MNFVVFSKLAGNSKSAKSPVLAIIAILPAAQGQVTASVATCQFTDWLLKSQSNVLSNIKRD